jgi:hypothetical protein
MAHQSLNRPEIIPFIQKGRGKGMSRHVEMNPLLDQGLFLPQQPIWMDFSGIYA